MTRNASRCAALLASVYLLVPGLALGQCGDVSISQNVDPLLVEELNSVGCFFPEGSTFNAYARCFSAAENHTADGPFAIDCIHFGVEDLEDTNGDGGDFIVTVRLAAYPAGCTAMPSFATGAGGTTLYEGTVAVSPDDSYPMLLEHVLPTPVTLPANTTLVVELLAPDAVEDDLFFAGSNAAGENGPTYYAAPECDFTVYTALAAVGFPEVNVVLSLDGSPATTVACCLGNGTCQDLSPDACTNQGGTVISGSCDQDCNNNGLADGCEILGGAGDCNGNGVLDECECVHDIDGNGVVNPMDLHFAMFKFGCDVGTGDVGCDAADVNCDGTVNPLDANEIAARFGDCP